MKKNHINILKLTPSNMVKTIRIDAIKPYKETPSEEMEGLGAHDLFSLFTANIIQEQVKFVR